ncbi:hypothetical protein FOA43_001249 [Brettanomyces nanus]|uniref:Uncharacterized protein n=1 Tax=Eeniella nana TaxID=13502 RepID=A0A875S3R7_EENNA|nr:uncharacterized protein FOA43_001249 [Brettanomyces nanus]QPG73934.1 hypothetical protein FOA43_001249 [Brettanomyces nanus]
MNAALNAPPVAAVELPDNSNSGEIPHGEWTEQFGEAVETGSTDSIRSTVYAAPRDGQDHSSWISRDTVSLLGSIVFYLLIIVMIAHYARWTYVYLKKKVERNRNLGDLLQRRQQQITLASIPRSKRNIFRNLYERNWTGGQVNDPEMALSIQQQPAQLPSYDQAVNGS